MKLCGSLRRRLMVALSVGVLAAWIATALFTYFDTRREADLMLDGLATDTIALREALGESIAAHLLHPLFVAVPVLATLIWFAVGWGLAPLRDITRQVEARDPRNLEPLRTPTPVEVQPLVTALDDLFGRIEASVQRERRFAADAAHELRTPLAAIRTHAQVALAARDAEERSHALRDVVHGTDRMVHLVGQLLTLTRAESAKIAFETVTLADIAARVVTESDTAARSKAVDLGITAADPAAQVTGNPHLLEAMIRNLVDNAVRYVPSGGRVDIEVRRAAERVTLRVADNGPGIPLALRPRMFERFHRGLGTGMDGSGLGLSIVAHVAALHRADIVTGDGLDGGGLSVAVHFPA